MLPHNERKTREELQDSVQQLESIRCSVYKFRFLLSPNLEAREIIFLHSGLPPVIEENLQVCHDRKLSQKEGILNRILLLKSAAPPTPLHPCQSSSSGSVHVVPAELLSNCSCSLFLQLRPKNDHQSWSRSCNLVADFLKDPLRNTR